MILVEKAPKISHPLSKQDVDKYTKKWFDIKNAPKNEMSDLEKRTEYDNLYNEVTNIVFKDFATTSHYKDLQELMRQAWLKLGFEAGDGNNYAINLAVDMGRRVDNPLGQMFKYIIGKYDSISDYLDANDTFLESFKNFLASRNDLWSSYSESDITSIIKSAYKLVKSKKSNEQREKAIDELAKRENLRDLVSDADNTSNQKNNTVTVKKITPKTSEKEQKAALKAMGYDLGTEEGKKMLQKIANS